MRLSISLSYKGKAYQTELSAAARLPEKPWPELPCTLKTVLADEKIELSITAEDEIELGEVVATIDRPFQSGETVFMNGYESWTDSREMGPDERMDSLGWLGKLLDRRFHFRSYGDYDFAPQHRAPGRFHGFSYCYLRKGGMLELFASVDEDSAFTILDYDCRRGRLAARRDCGGRRLARGESFRLMALRRYRGDDAAAFDAWFAEMGTPKPAAKPLAGWTSWYYHYQAINEATILANLEAFAKTFPGERVFQIDDGYQTAVGDWLSIDGAKFPRGLGEIARRVHDAGFKAGLWLAPFAAQESSRLVAEHPEWLLRDEAGRPIPAGSNWGPFYGLDIRHEGVRNYLRAVFATVLDDWGFDLVKLDFLYAACLRPFPEATRGELMAEAMRFLRETIGAKLILGCGVPLASAFGRIDYCRIGCDIDLGWKSAWHMKHLHRERVSTPRAIGNTVGRRQLDGRAFLNDPDVFILRDERTKLSPAQREILFFINTLLGSLVFTSDRVDTYGPAAAGLFGGIDAAMGRKLLELHEGRRGKLLELRYRDEDGEHRAAINLDERRVTLRPASGRPGAELILEPFELRII